MPPMKPSCYYSVAIKGKPNLPAVGCPKVCYFHERFCSYLLIYLFLLCLKLGRPRISLVHFTTRFLNSITSTWGSCSEFSPEWEQGLILYNAIGQDVAIWLWHPFKKEKEEEEGGGEGGGRRGKGKRGGRGSTPLPLAVLPSVSSQGGLPGWEWARALNTPQGGWSLQFHWR